MVALRIADNMHATIQKQLQSEYGQFIGDHRYNSTDHYEGKAV